jgi:hypothetical protein
MTYPNRKNSPEIELWNVSLLPTVKVAVPPPGPAPLGGGALKKPALLSVAEDGPASIAHAA